MREACLVFLSPTKFRIGAETLRRGCLGFPFRQNHYRIDFDADSILARHNGGIHVAGAGEGEGEAGGPPR